MSLVQIESECVSDFSDLLMNEGQAQVGSAGWEVGSGSGVL